MVRNEMPFFKEREGAQCVYSFERVILSSSFQRRKSALVRNCNGFVSKTEDGRLHYLKSFQG